MIRANGELIQSVLRLLGVDDTHVTSVDLHINLHDWPEIRFTRLCGINQPIPGGIGPEEITKRFVLKPIEDKE